MTTYGEMIEATRAAVGARNSARDELAKRLEGMIDDLLRTIGGKAVVVGGYRIEWVTAEAVCSEWADGSRPVTAEETVTLITAGPNRAGEVRLARSFGQVDLSHFDGHNMQHQLGRATYAGRSISVATVAMLRDIVAALPAVVAQSLHDCQQRMAAETTTAREAIESLEFCPLCPDNRHGQGYSCAGRS